MHNETELLREKLQDTEVLLGSAMALLLTNSEEIETFLSQLVDCGTTEESCDKFDKDFRKKLMEYVDGAE